MSALTLSEPGRQAVQQGCDAARAKAPDCAERIAQYRRNLTKRRQAKDEQQQLEDEQRRLEDERRSQVAEEDKRRQEEAALWDAQRQAEEQHAKEAARQAEEQRAKEAARQAEEQRAREAALRAAQRQAEERQEEERYQEERRKQRERREAERREEERQEEERYQEERRKQRERREAERREEERQEEERQEEERRKRQEKEDGRRRVEAEQQRQRDAQAAAEIEGLPDYDDVFPGEKTACGHAPPPAPPAPAAPPAPLDPQLVRINGKKAEIRYRLDAFLGAGTFGRVYKGWYAGAEAAVKVIRLNPEYHPDTYSYQIKAAYGEIKTMELVKDAPSVVRLLDYDSHANPRPSEVIATLVFPLYEGDLRSKLAWIREEGSRVVRAMRGITEGLTALHKAGVIHGDLKGENILVCADPRQGLRLAISDFGKSTTTSPQDVYVNCRREPWDPGTYDFCAPELFIKPYRWDATIDCLVIISLLDGEQDCIVTRERHRQQQGASRGQSQDVAEVHLPAIAGAMGMCVAPDVPPPNRAFGHLSLGLVWRIIPSDARALWRILEAVFTYNPLLRAQRISQISATDWKTAGNEIGASVIYAAHPPPRR